MNLGRAIRLNRQASSLSQSELADRVRISASYLSLVESGRRDPSFALVRDVANELGVSLDLLFLMSIDFDAVGKREANRLAAVIEKLVGAVLGITSGTL